MADLSRQRQTEREREELLVSAHPRPRIRVWARQGRDGLRLGYSWAWVAQYFRKTKEHNKKLLHIKTKQNKTSGNHRS